MGLGTKSRLPDFWQPAKFMGTLDKKQIADFFRFRKYSLQRAQKADCRFWQPAKFMGTLDKKQIAGFLAIC